MGTWNTERLLGLSRQFMEARIVLSAAELDVFTVLAGTPKTLDETAAALKSTARGTAILLDALSALGLLNKEEGRYACPAEVAEALSSASPESILPMLRHMASVWARWSDLTAIVRQGPVERPTGLFSDPEELAAFIGAMHVVGRQTAETIVAAAGAEGAHNLLDVGGATGTYAEAFLRAYPALRATIFDQPSVIELARKRLTEAGMMDRVALSSGDFYKDELPGAHDLVLLSAIIHQNSPEENGALYRKAWRALTPGGRILIRDHILRPDRTAPPGAAVFAVNMLSATNGGNCYTLDEIRESLETAGFSRIGQIQADARMDGLIEAFKA